MCLVHRWRSDEASKGSRFWSDAGGAGGAGYLFSRSDWSVTPSTFHEPGYRSTTSTSNLHFQLALIKYNMFSTQ